MHTRTANAGFGAGHRNAASWAAEGRNFHTTRRYPEAINAYKRATELEPNNAAYWSALGCAYFANHAFANATPAFQRATALAPANASFWVQLGHAYSRQGGAANYNQAAVSYTRAASIEPSKALYWHLAGTAHVGNSNYLAASTAYQKATTLEPNNSTYWKLLGDAFYHQGGATNFSQAAVAYTRAANIEPNKAAYWSLVGNAHYSNKDYLLASQSYRQATNLESNNVNYWVQLGHAFYKQEGPPSFKQAVIAYTRAANIEPNKALYWSLVGNAHISDSDYLSASQAYRQATNLEPNNINYWLQLGRAYIHLKGKDNYIEAAKAYKKVIELEPNNAAHRSSLGCVYYEQGDYTEASSAFLQATDLAPANAVYWLQLGNAYLGDANYNEAIKAYLKAIGLEKNNAAYWHLLGYTYLLQKDYTNARLACTKAVSIEPQNIGYRKKLGDIYYLQEDYEQALDEYNHALHIISAAENVSSDYPELRRRRKLSVRRLEKARLLEACQGGESIKDYLDKLNGHNDTLLHRMAKDSQLKHCARLLFLGANSEAKNKDSRLPLSYLSSYQLEKVRGLRDQLGTLIAHLNESPTHILMPKITISYAELDKKKVEQTLNELYSKPEIKPLLDLAKLAALGLHDLSNRSKFAEVDYDSDDDANEGIASTQNLAIHIDAKSTTVEGICHCGEDGLAGKAAYGIYIKGKNTVYVGGVRDNKYQIRGTLIHELTHFITQEVFQNNCNPYSESDDVNEIRFNDIIEKLILKKETLDTILRQVFDLKLYSPFAWHQELIVRVPQMILAYPDGLTRLQTQAPELLSYYTDVFLEAVKNHNRKLEQRALSKWPKELFTQDYIGRGSFVFHCDNVAEESDVQFEILAAEIHENIQKLHLSLPSNLEEILPEPIWGNAQGESSSSNSAGDTLNSYEHWELEGDFEGGAQEDNRLNFKC